MAHSDKFHVPFGLHFWSGIVSRHPGFWKAAGNFETRLLQTELDTIKITKPVYVTGMPRAGTTLLLEILASLDESATHRYQDYPFIFTPYFWRTFLKFTPAPAPQARERAHGDRMMVTAASPEAIEEMIWMAFFAGLHDPARSNALDAATASPAFETFYREHIQKLLLVSRASRYVAKSNYNLTRIPYLLRIFPDARFVVPVRHPVSHIASLVRQHENFSKGEEASPRALAYMRRVGHFEFGLDRRPVNAGNDGLIREIENLWSRGEDIRAWARYWDHLHRYLRQLAEGGGKIKNALHIVAFENLCRQPERELAAILDHCDFAASPEFIGSWSARIEKPAYYRPDLSETDIKTIEQETGETAAFFGYNSFSDF